MKLTQEQIDRVKSLEGPRGEVTAQQVLDDARLKKSPLHELFDWDRDKAAENHWLECARGIIRAVRVVVTNETTTFKAPNYVRDMTSAAQGYRSVFSLKTDPVQARESLIYTLEAAAGHIRRAYEVAGALGLQDEMEQLLDQILGLTRRVSEAA